MNPLIDATAKTIRRHPLPSAWFFTFTAATILAVVGIVYRRPGWILWGGVGIGACIGFPTGAVYLGGRLYDGSTWDLIADAFAKAQEPPEDEPQGETNA